MFVLLDSNIWITELGLKSNKAIKLLKLMQARGATLAIPEVVRHEVEIKLCEKLRVYGEKSRVSLSYVSTIMTTVDELKLPSDAEIRVRVEGLLNEVDVSVKEIRLSLEAAQSSLKRILYKLPPSDRQEQFIDGVIWDNCLLLLMEADVLFVTGDTAFYHKRKYSDGLASSLKKEVFALPNNLYLYSCLDLVLSGEVLGEQRVRRDILPDFDV